MKYTTFARVQVLSRLQNYYVNQRFTLFFSYWWQFGWQF